MKEEKNLSTYINSWRIFPRMFITLYMILLYDSTQWFMKLETPTVEQMGLIATIVGAGAAWFNTYTKTGITKGDND
jgi:hypothetical protein